MHNIVIMSMWCIYEKYMLLYGVYIVDISGKWVGWVGNIYSVCIARIRIKLCVRRNF